MLRVVALAVPAVLAPLGLLACGDAGEPRANPGGRDFVVDAGRTLDASGTDASALDASGTDAAGADADAAGTEYRLEIEADSETCEPGQVVSVTALYRSYPPEGVFSPIGNAIIVFSLAGDADDAELAPNSGMVETSRGGGATIYVTCGQVGTLRVIAEEPTHSARDELELTVSLP